MDKILKHPKEFFVGDYSDYQRWEFKFVIFNDNSIVFFDACDYYNSHKNVANQYPDKNPIGAGKIKIADNVWNLREQSSTTLNMNCNPDLDYKGIIQTALGNEYNSDEYIY